MEVETVLCAWCHQPFVRPPWGSGEPQGYCSALHRRWAVTRSRGEFPVADCPRCGVRDLRVVDCDWGICQTCGYQTDRPDLLPGQLAPRNIYGNHSDLRERMRAARRTA